MTTDALAPAAVMTRTWRVTPDRTDVVPTLRDYLRRLGASVEVGEAGAVEFATAEPDHEIDVAVAELSDIRLAWRTIAQDALH